MKFPAAAAVVLLFFAAAAADLGLRSRSALREARRYEVWLADPALKKRYYDSGLDKRLSILKKEVSAGRVKREEADGKAALFEAERDFYLAESSAKLAWLWYKTAAEKFYFPFNPWAAQARKRLPAARRTWQAELSAKGAETGDWMFD